MNSVSLSGLAGRYDNLIPTWFLAPIEFLKILAQKRKDIPFYRGKQILAVVFAEL
jgi:hypothetical protein